MSSPEKKELKPDFSKNYPEVTKAIKEFKKTHDESLKISALLSDEEITKKTQTLMTMYNEFLKRCIKYGFIPETEKTN